MMTRYSKLPTSFTNRIVGDIFPDRLFCKMVFAITKINAVASLVSDTVFKANDIYDPTLVGGSYRGFNYLSQLYSRFTVYGSKITVQYQNTSGNVSSVIAVVPSSSQLAFTSYDSSLEQPRGKYTNISSIYNYATLSHYQSSMVPLGVTKRQMEDLDFSGSLSIPSAPNQAWWWHIVVGSTDTVVGVTGVIKIKMVAYVQLFDRLQVPI